MIIRPITADDAEAALPLLANLLDASCAAGSRVLPTPQNVDNLFAQAVAGAAEGDPCLIAVNDDGVALGLVVWKGQPVDTTIDGKVCYGLGTVVAPHARRQGVSRLLRDRATQIARERGYTVVFGAAYAKDALQACIDAGFHIVGVMVEKPLC
jgi:GNAT superfamily N-acetyltransferase